MKIAVVGAGIFGSTIAIALAKKGYDVELFEKESDIMQAASGINQFRLHRGYHYPRSASTAISSRDGEASFREEYGEAVIDDNEHYYCIASAKSKTSKEQFIDFCKKCNLEYSIVELPHADSKAHELAVKVKESLIDYPLLKSIVWGKLIKNKVKTYFNKIFSLDTSDHDLVVNCTYANLNSLYEDTVHPQKEYQFEVCEKPLIKLPKEFYRKSIVILDGPFFCIDPYGRTDMHLMGNVVHAIHATNTGIKPNIPESIRSVLNKGIIKNPQVTNFKKFIESAIEIMPEMKRAEHIGSMYTVRTVLPNTDKTDERPTVVSRVNDRVIHVFSGKIGNCVDASRQVIALIEKL
jgi:hypothetical protein